MANMADKTYHPCFLQWPPLLRPLTQLAELPERVLDRYNAVQTVAFCGVFPEIRRAWASVDNALFLWRLDRWCAGALPALCGNTCMTNKYGGQMAMQHQPCRNLTWLRMRTHTSRLMR